MLYEPSNAPAEAKKKKPFTGLRTRNNFFTTRSSKVLLAAYNPGDDNGNGNNGYDRGNVQLLRSVTDNDMPGDKRKPDDDNTTPDN